ncbi:hypothetical protein L6164_032592 [Bauhinia variegata]|uniref:Uncharacterized protein n=1 Tax=Bauhinia variegata TaxID=167791 RepID=A0ACB9KP74_BAUVA|nr:hypothetical protein L6164_032592 [Bauhinia variegata]
MLACLTCREEKKHIKTMETYTLCRTCRKGVLLPTTSAAYRCSVCKTVSASFSRQEQSCERGGMRHEMRKLGAKLFGHGLPDSSNKNVDMIKHYQTYPAYSLSRRCNKRAVLCGVTYRSRKLRLKGPTNDVNNMKELLKKVFEFPEESILVLTEQENDIQPTKKNILESLHWLVKDCQPGDSLVFYFSGHGLQQPDSNEDESDGFDESLCPVDFLREGMIVDDDINSILVWPLQKGVTLHAIVDACHSGTVLDLTCFYNQKNGIWENDSPPAKEPMRKHTSGGLAICLSACGDNQMASDTTAFGGKGMNGVLTYIFTKIIKENPEITYGGLLEKIHEEIQKVIQRKFQLGFLKHVFRNNKISQDPILSSSEKFDVSRRKFTL